jgi:hypothetical protein
VLSKDCFTPTRLIKCSALPARPESTHNTCHNKPIGGKHLLATYPILLAHYASRPRMQCVPPLPNRHLHHILKREVLPSCRDFGGWRPFSAFTNGSLLTLALVDSRRLCSHLVSILQVRGSTIFLGMHAYFGRGIHVHQGWL